MDEKKQKQIEEMAYEIETRTGYLKSTCYISAEILYNAGYRKQSEGEWFEQLDGTHYCSNCGHDATAKKICNKLNISYERRFLGVDTALYSLGWCKLAISSIGNKQYWVHWERPLTAYQRYFLKEYFENEKDLKFKMNITSYFQYFHEDEFFPATEKGGEG